MTHVLAMEITSWDDKRMDAHYLIKLDEVIVGTIVSHYVKHDTSEILSETIFLLRDYAYNPFHGNMDNDYFVMVCSGTDTEKNIRRALALPPLEYGNR